MGRQMDRLLDSVDGQVLSVGKREASAKDRCGLSSEQGCGTRFSLQLW